MNNWIEIDEDYERLWTFADKNLCFIAHHQDKNKVIIPPAPNKCFDVDDFLEENNYNRQR